MKKLFLILTMLLTPNKGNTEIGVASYYGKGFHGKKTASGKIFNKYGKTGAHRKLPFGTHVKVTNLNNGLTTTVEITDRGPFIKGRIIDLSEQAAQELGFQKKGIAKVSIEVVNIN